MTVLPSLFLSHGAPDTAIADTRAAEFLRSYAATIDRPRAIVVVSAHFEMEGRVEITADARPETIHDFGGFDAALYEMTYPAPGDPDLAARIAEHLVTAGFEASTAANRGFDHGTWVPLKLLYPDADIPVVQVSVDPGKDAAYHLALGRALAPLRRDGVLVVGSGSFTHNLGEAFKALRVGHRDAPVPVWVEEFVDWMDQHIRNGDFDALVDYRAQAPYARENHPTEEHLVPLHAAIGAATGAQRGTWRAEPIHASDEFGVLSMNAYAFHG